MNTLILLLHISVASVLGILVLASCLSILTNSSQHYIKLFYTLGAGLLIQAITGSLLELTAAHPSLFLVFCSKVFLYLGIVVGTQLVLAVRMLKLDIKASYKYIACCAGISILTTLTAGLLMA